MVRTAIAMITMRWQISLVTVILYDSPLFWVLGWWTDIRVQTTSFYTEQFVKKNIKWQWWERLMMKFQADGNDRKAKLVALKRETIAMIAIMRWQDDVEAVLTIMQGWADNNEQSEWQWWECRPDNHERVGRSNETRECVLTVMIRMLAMTWRQW